MATTKKKVKKIAALSNHRLFISAAVFTILGFVLGILYMMSPFYVKPYTGNFEAFAAKKEPWYLSYIKCDVDPNSTDKTPPTVKIISPEDGAIIPKGDGKANVRIVAVASDNVTFGGGETKSSFYVNGEVRDLMPYEWIYNDTPYDFYWGAPNPSPNKTYSFSVKICDAAGNEAWSPTIKVITDR
ncbi:MAG TPA: Ig-like domain-containing protein [Patescibacteria group bacterium]|nr:Ig-like domain-containing protein [Patescibacteria group bacterium]